VRALTVSTYGRSLIGSTCIRSAVARATPWPTTLPFGSNVVTHATALNVRPSCESSIVRLTLRVPVNAPVCGSKRKWTPVAA
jgi:hypothetical protein